MIARTVIIQPSIFRIVVTLLLVVSGLGVASQGVIPAEMVNGVANVASASTRGHFISSLISAAAWAIGAFLLVRPMRRSSSWRGLHLISIGLVALTLASAIFLRGIVPDGLAQRIGNGLFLGSVCCNVAKVNSARETDV